METDKLKQLTPNVLVSEASIQRDVEKLQFFLSSDEVNREVPRHFLDIVRDYHGCEQVGVEIGQPGGDFYRITVNLGEKVPPIAVIEMQQTLDAVNVAARLGPRDMRELKESYTRLAEVLRS